MAKHNVPENVATVIKEIGLSRDQAGWDCHGTFVLLHKALEKVAAKKKIVFEQYECFSFKYFFYVYIFFNVCYKLLLF